MKVWNYMMIILTMMVFLLLIGVKPATTDLLSDIGLNIDSTNATITTGDISNSAWYSKLFSITDGILILLISIGGAIVVGLFGKQVEWKIILLPFFTTFVVKFVQFAFGLLEMSKERWLDGIIATIFFPLTAMFIFSIVEWFGGTE